MPKLLPRTRGPMPLIFALLLFLTTLAAAAAILLSSAAAQLRGGERLTVQIMAADPAMRDAEASRALHLLQRDGRVVTARQIGAAEMEALLAPWLGANPDETFPVPALIEAELGSGAKMEAIGTAIRAAAPSAIVNAEAHWLAPVRRLVSLLRWIAAGLAVVAALAMAATVSLAARTAFAAHGETIGLMHLLGATDRQLVRLFERRTAIEALAGGLLGWFAAMLVLLLLADRLEALGEVPLGTMAVAPVDMLRLLALPLAGAALAMLVARITLLRALKANR